MRTAGSSRTSCFGSEHVYADGTNNYLISATVDGIGTVSPATQPVKIKNAAPSLTVDQASVTADEGQPVSNSGTYGDVPADTVSVTASIGTVMFATGVWSWSYNAADGPAAQVA